MKISIIQLNSILGEKEKNYENVALKIKEAIKEHPDVLVLPELFDTGFFPINNQIELSDCNGEKTIEFFSKIAKTNSINIIAGSILNNRKNQIYNTSFIFDRFGNNIASYDKIHLFSPMNENKFFSSGEKIVKFNIDNISAGIIICYDLRFPELSRILALRNIDILFVVSQWPDTRINILHNLLKARAIENQFFVACANGCGENENTKFGGESVIINPLGEILIKASKDEEIITCDIDLSIIKDIRDRINVFNDRRDDIYSIKTI